MRTVESLMFPFLQVGPVHIIFILHEALFSLKLKINFAKLESIMVIVSFPLEYKHKNLYIDRLCALYKHCSSQSKLHPHSTSPMSPDPSRLSSFVLCAVYHTWILTSLPKCLLSKCVLGRNRNAIRARLPGCLWNATPRSRSPLERNNGFWTQA